MGANNQSEHPALPSLGAWKPTPARLVGLIALFTICAEVLAENNASRNDQVKVACAGPEQVPVQIAAGRRLVALCVEIAASEAQRSRGLMDRERLTAEEGMLFVYPQPQPPHAGFWMFRTRFPLDIAFLDAQGRILAIRAMEPCASSHRRRCPTYAAGVEYLAALEVNRGFFARERIAIGDRVIFPDNLLPAAGSESD